MISEISEHIGIDIPSALVAFAFVLLGILICLVVFRFHIIPTYYIRRRRSGRHQFHARPIEPGKL